MTNSVCDFCGKQVWGRKPVSWGGVWIHFNRTEDRSPVDVYFDVCSPECIARVLPESLSKAVLTETKLERGR